ncbi:MAG TPA: hypothetical protein DCS93_23820 [Microscillaceae bacterium]|nr:hypothetical protein [Microscillaceae bacterium]
MTQEPQCSFCNKSRLDVGLLIQGEHAYICEDCITLSFDIMLDEVSSENSNIQLTMDMYNTIRRVAKKAVKIFEDK